MDSAESELALRARSGDNEALADLVEANRQRLFAVAYAELRDYDRAQDAVASALVQICLHLRDLRNPERFAAWTRSVVRNEARIIRRTVDWLALNERADSIADSADQIAAAEIRLDIERALLRIPRDQAHAAALFYLAGISVAGIARRVGRPEGTIKRWLHLARRRLAHEMEGYGPMDEPLEAAIISTDLPQSMIDALSRALRTAGFETVQTVDGLPPLEWTGTGGSLEYHLPADWRGIRLVVLDDYIGGRSAFEQYLLLRATIEGRQMGVCQLLDSGAEAGVFAAWAAGCDLCFTKPSLDMADFSRCLLRWRQRENQAES